MLTRVEVGGHKHAVYVSGTVLPPLVFVHGFPLDHTMWRNQLAHFAKSRQVIAPDLPGFGQTPLDCETKTIETYADGVDSVLTALGVAQPVILCGLSMGGSIALQFALRHRNRLAGLIICDARAAADTEEAKQVRRNVADRALREGPSFMADTIETRLISESTARSQPNIKQELAEVIRRTPAQGVAAGSLALGSRADVTEKLHEIDVPALVIVGEHDVISPPAEMRGIADRLPQATFVEVAGAGHMAPLEAPDVVNAAIEHFLTVVV